MVIVGFFREDIKFAKYCHLCVCPKDIQWVTRQSFNPHEYPTAAEWGQEAEDMLAGDFSKISYNGGYLYGYHGSDLDIIKEILGLQHAEFKWSPARDITIVKGVDR